jgi:hypothetical protein
LSIPNFITAPLADANAPALTLDAAFAVFALAVVVDFFAVAAFAVVFLLAAGFFADFFSAIIQT